MKRFFTILFAFLFLLSLAACKNEETPDETSASQVLSAETATDETTDSETVTETEQNGTDAATDDPEEDFSEEDEDPADDPEDPDDPDEPEYPDDVEDPDEYEYPDVSGGRKFLACDITNRGIVVFDLDACGGNYQQLKNGDAAVVWEWLSDNDPNCETGGPNYGIDSAKYRYSPYYGKNVVIACSSNGWVGVIDYGKCSLLWECVISGGGPHSVEMLPNGDLVVAVSNNPGALAYIPLSAGADGPVDSIPSLYCHGVCWDPQREHLWVLEDNGVYAADISNMGTMDGEVVRLSNTVVFPSKQKSAHAFSPVYGQPGKYWASSGSALWQFDAETETWSNAYSCADALTAKNIKGIASFSDGTVVETIANIGGACTKGWSCDGLRIISAKTGKVTDVLFDPLYREFYKVQPFTTSYR